MAVHFGDFIKMKRKLQIEKSRYLYISVIQFPKIAHMSLSMFLKAVTMFYK